MVLAVDGLLPRSTRRRPTAAPGPGLVSSRRGGPGSGAASPTGRPSRRPGAGRLIAAGRDTLIAAPTGSGKTLAGFLVAIDALYRAHEAGEDVEVGARVVYVSPLRALAVDIAENLERPLAEIAAVAAELGLSPPHIRVAVRTGDTTSAAAVR